MPMKIKEAAKFMGVHPNTLRNMERDGLIAPYRFGKRQDRYYSKWMLVRAMVNTTKSVSIGDLEELNNKYEKENQEGSEES